MVRVSTGHSELEVTVRGEGEPVLLIHGGFIGGAIFDTLCLQPQLRDNYQLITYDRHGYGKSSRPQESYTLDNIVDDALAVLQHVRADQAHVVGHSAGGTYALQLAMDHPDVVRSIIAIEPGVPTPDQAQFLQEHMTPAREAFQAGDSPTALDISLGAVSGGTNYRSQLDEQLPDGWYEQAVADLGYAFMFDGPSMRSFSFGPEEAKRIRQPLLILQGEQSADVFVKNNEFLAGLIPHAEKRIVPGANHFCQVLNPSDSASAIASFFAAHPIPQETVR